jgi:hypothetical protein
MSTTRHFILGALVALPLGASAQSNNSVEPFVGVWSGVFTTQDNPYWTFADIQCFVGCDLDFYNRLSALLANPANDSNGLMWRLFPGTCSIRSESNNFAYLTKSVTFH